MRSKKLYTFILVLLVFLPLSAQKDARNSITRHDLEMHMEFLSSDELEGRNTGEPGLQVAARYLEVQAKHLGLKPVNGDDGFHQYFFIEEKAYDLENSMITISGPDSTETVNREPFYVFPAVDGEKLDMEGEVVFAGYGIKDDEHSYDDFKDVDIAGKVVLIMNRAPMNEEGTESQFGQKWMGLQNMQFKMPVIMSKGPKAVLIVLDPKSGMNSIEDMGQGITRYLSRSRSIKEEQADIAAMGMVPKIILIHRSVADQLLAGSGKDLAELQKEIDGTLESRSFELEDTHMDIHLEMLVEDLEVSNVFGIIEGADPDLKEEVVLYLAHYDHVGIDDEGEVFNGADDNASGTVALLEIAEAFMKEKKRPARSIGILWVTAEEIGLFGSQYFANHSLIPEGKTVAAINLDMVGRTLNQADLDSGDDGITVQAGDSVKVIGGLQSKVLMKINEKTLKEMGLVGNYEFNVPDHPKQYFYRSDHISFARKDIPVLSYSTGTHKDYHKVTDTEDAIDYDKFLKMTRFAYMVGFNVARHKSTIEVDNPMSGW